ncbi:uncharacterized protein GBIM_03730 [Gryllus bimaculatus]|nr:uncharacterized protein GBIM_03730 [Gryllus bimaculatus]
MAARLSPARGRREARERGPAGRANDVEWRPFAGGRGRCGARYGRAMLWPARANVSWRQLPARRADCRLALPAGAVGARCAGSFVDLDARSTRPCARRRLPRSPPPPPRRGPPPQRCRPPPPASSPSAAKLEELPPGAEAPALPRPPPPRPSAPTAPPPPPPPSTSRPARLRLSLQLPCTTASRNRVLLRLETVAGGRGGAGAGRGWAPLARRRTRTRRAGVLTRLWGRPRVAARCSPAQLPPRQPLRALPRQRPHAAPRGRRAAAGRAAAERAHSPGYRDDNAYWVGASDVMYEGDFRWSDGFPFRYTNWFPGWEQHKHFAQQPNDDGTSQLDCVELRRVFALPSAGVRLAHSFMWNDMHCQARNFFVCERPRVGEAAEEAGPADCNRSLTLSRDVPRTTVVSPGFPHRYPDNVECATLVTAPPGYRLVIDFEELVLEDEADKNYLTISRFVLV